MHTLGISISLCAFALEVGLVLRGAQIKVFRSFPLFYSYITYATCATVALYIIYFLDRPIYRSLFWINYLINDLAEFAVLVEISDHVFKPLVAIRSLGRALTIALTTGFGLLYILPTILWARGSTAALADFTLRVSLTKAIILAALFFAAWNYSFPLSRNVAGLMLGFAIYVAMNVAMMASAKAFSSSLVAGMLWVLSPLGSALCMLVWTTSLWELAPIPRRQASGRDAETVALELTRFNSDLSRFLHK